MASGGASTYRRVTNNRILHKIEEVNQLRASVCANIDRVTNEVIQESYEFIKMNDKKQRKASFRKINGILEACILMLTSISDIQLCQDEDEESSNDNPDSVVSDIESPVTSIASNYRLSECNHHLTEAMSPAIPVIAHDKHSIDQQLSDVSPVQPPLSSDPPCHTLSTYDTTLKVTNSKLRADTEEFIPKGLEVNRSRLNSVSCVGLTEIHSVAVKSLVNVSDDLAQISTVGVEQINMPEEQVHVGQTFSGIILYVESPTNFYLRKLNNKDMDNLFDKLSSFYEEIGEPTLVDANQLRCGMACCALEPKMNAWQRAVIAEIHDATNTPQVVTVFYVDTGESEELPVTKLFKLDDQFLQMSRQAIRCSLNGVDQMSPWNHEHVSIFKNLVSGLMLSVVVIHTEGPANSVDLFISPCADKSERINVSRGFLKSLATKNEAALVISNGMSARTTEQEMIAKESNEEHAFSGGDSGGAVLLPSTHKFSFKFHSGRVPTLSTLRPPAFEKWDCSINEINQGAKDNAEDKMMTTKTDHAAVEPDVRLLNAPLTIPPLQLKIKEPTRTFTALMASVTDPSNFYVHPVMYETAQIDNLTDELDKIYAKSAPPLFLEPKETFTIGSYWCCRFPNNDSWYRGKITDTSIVEPKAEFNKNVVSSSLPKMKVHILYIDYGNTAWIDIDQLRILRKKFCQLPSLAVKCRLANVGHGKQPDGTWSPTSINLVKTFAKDEPLKLELIENTDEGLDVLVWNKKDVLLNDVLLALNSSQLSAETHKQNLNNGSVGNLSDGEDSTVDDLKCWDPMQDTYMSPRNSYNIDVDDAGVALTGYKARDETNICHFYRRGLHCRRGNACSFKHIAPPTDGRTTDTKIIPNITESVELPNVNSRVAVEVTAILDPNFFYVNFPLATVESIDKLSDDDFQLDPNNLYALVDYMQSEYKSEVDHHGDYLVRALGELVVAKSSLDGKWYRARVVDVDQLAHSVTVSFVDYGNCEVVLECNVRDIKSKFLHLPLQAVECSLSDLEPADGNQWSDDAKKMFAQLTIGRNVVAQVMDIVEEKLIVELSVMDNKQSFDVSPLLVNARCASRKVPTAVFFTVD